MVSMGKLMTQTLGGNAFFVHPKPVGRLTESPGNALRAGNVVPVTILDNTLLDVSNLDEIFTKFATFDDVYQGAFEDFAKNVVVSSEGYSHDMAKQLHLDGEHQLRTTARLPSGPYFLVGQDIHQAWRLYSDDLDAFAIATVPEDPLKPERYMTLDANHGTGVWKSIAVPSRLYFTASDKPLAGKRVALKDCIDLAGIQTTMMSRPYTELYGPVENSADYARQLIQLGAIIIGKSKMTAFASSDEPTDQWIDFHCPTNPRGDRYQSPSGSSAGAAAALAGYPWLDHSIGADTAGSIRAPATCNGLFSLRTSYGATSMKGIMANCDVFDVVGILARDLTAMRELVSLTFDLKSSRKYPAKILYPTEFFPHSNTQQQAMVDEYVSVLESFLGTKRTVFSLAERWSQCPPTEAEGLGLKDYLGSSAFKTQCYEYYHIFKPYRDAYRSKFKVDGEPKQPYAGAIVSYRWATGEAVTDQEAEKYRQKLHVFRKWFSENVLGPTDDLLSDAIMIMPYGGAKPKYRDAPNEPPSGSHTLGEKFISPVLQLPQLVLPIGQMPYDSRVTERLEHRPIAGTIVAAKGSDMMLISLAEEAFKAAGWPTKVKTGRYMFDLANNTRNTANVDHDLLQDSEWSDPVQNAVAKHLKMERI